MVDLGEIANERLSDTNLTVQDLLAVVEQIVTERLKIVQQSAPDSPYSGLADWWQSMVNELIVPVAGTPSASEMLREERDQWYKPS